MLTQEEIQRRLVQGGWPDTAHGLSALIMEYVIEERERILKIVHEHFINYRGASIQTVFSEDAKAQCADVARAIGEIEKEIRGT